MDINELNKLFESEGLEPIQLAPNLGSREYRRKKKKVINKAINKAKSSSSKESK